MEDKKIDSSIQEINIIAPRTLSIEELESFREDHRELEKEIQNFFRVYYLSGLLLAAAWFVSPQSKPFIELAIGNGGYNIYALLALAGLNIVSTTILLYKGILIHDIAQFMSYMSANDSAFNYWERWRRTRGGAEFLARIFYNPLLMIVPLMLSNFIMYTTWNIIYLDHQTLRQRIEQAQSPNLIVSGTSSVENIQKTEESYNEKRKAYIEKITPVLHYSRLYFWITGILHIVPVFLIFLSIIVVPREWRKIQKTQDSTVMFEYLKNPVLKRLALMVKRFPRKNSR